jgi:hypothetical protein
MSQATLARLSARIHAMIPPDELIGSLTRQRITLLVQEAGEKYIEDGHSPAKHWLAYALNTDIPDNAFEQVCAAFTQAREVENCDLVWWYDLPNTIENRAQLQRGADLTIDFAVEVLANRLCSQLGVS